MELQGATEAVYSMKNTMLTVVRLTHNADYISGRDLSGHKQSHGHCFTYLILECKPALMALME